MDLQETSYWIDSLFPGDVQISELNGFYVATIELADEETPDEALACTADFGQVDTGLLSAEMARGTGNQVEVRAELFCVAATDTEVVARAVVAAASFLTRSNAQEPGTLPAQPGQLLPGIGVLAGFGGMPEVTVRHGLLVAPYVWADGVPRITEPDRITTMLQLVLLTDAEFEHASTYGVVELQKAMVDEGINLLDVGR